MTDTTTDLDWIEDACEFFDKEADSIGYSHHPYSGYLRVLAAECDAKHAEIAALKAENKRLRESLTRIIWVLDEDHGAMAAQVYRYARAALQDTDKHGETPMADALERLATGAYAREVEEAKADAFKAGMLRAAEIVKTCGWGDYWNLDGEHVEPLSLAEAIRAEAEGER